jgi:hypothetical protein
MIRDEDSDLSLSSTAMSKKADKRYSPILPPPIAGLNEAISELNGMPTIHLTGEPGFEDEEVDPRILVGVKGDVNRIDVERIKLI